MPDFSQFNTKYPGEGTFAENLKNVLKARPQISQYPRVSTALGQAIVNTLLGKGSPQDNLNTAATAANGFLAVPG
jgi:multiple sugar transport system substrate-binding protein